MKNFRIYFILMVAHLFAANMQAQFFAVTLSQNTPKCSDSKDGNCTANVIGGKPPYFYDWSNGERGVDKTFIDGLVQGKYSVTVTDNDGATTDAGTNLTAPTPIIIQMNTTNGSCDGTINGSIIPTVFGGLPPYSYSWSNGSTTPTIPEISFSGKYFLTITDANGCKASEMATIMGKMGFNYDIVKISTQNPKGKINITNIQGGKPPYEYTVRGKKGFSITTTNSSIDISVADEYFIEVKDSEGCISSQNGIYVFSENELFLTSFSNKSDCQKATGTASVSYLNGSPPMTYKWSDGSEYNNIANVGMGVYSVTVTDSKGIKGFTNIEVLGDLNLEIQSQIPCNGPIATSTVKVLSGGESPYTYLWSNNATTPTINNLPTGIYHVTVSDKNGCKDTSVARIVFNKTIQTYIQVNHEKCPILEPLFFNGIAPYTYLWSTGVQTSELSVYGVNQGLFTLTVTDSQGCIGTVQTNYSSFSYTPQFDLITCGNVARVVPKCDLSIPNLNYKWSNGSTSNFIKNVPIGKYYYITVTDNLYNNGGKTATAFIDGLNPCAQFIEGKVLLDLDSNCKKDATDVGLKERMIEILPGPIYVKTDDKGEFIAFANDGDYTFNVIAPNPYESMCLPNTKITLKDSAKVDVMIKSATFCPYLSVDITTPRLRRCFSNTYFVRYCNKGTATAKNAYIKLDLDKDLIYISASIPLASQNANTLIFNVGDVAVGVCKTFNFTAELNCNGTVLGQTHCIEAHIYPDSLCLPPPPSWSGAKVAANAVCNGTEVSLTLKNTGDQAMATAKNYFIIEDQVLYKIGTFKLNNNEIKEFKFPANGKTYRIEAEQEGNFPLTPSKPSAWVEACGTNAQGIISTGFVPMFGNNGAAPFSSIDCHQSIGAYDPNLKSAYPLGYENSHFIPQNEDLEYTIQFQNEGTDTAFTVILLDTLSNLSNVNTLQMGVSSHPYEWTLGGTGILKVIFKNILLPTKKQNDAASQGFVSFRITQKKNNLLGSVLKNRAGIYFDFNSVILTNEVFHTIGKDFVRVTFVKNPNLEKLDIKIYPNPMQDEAVFYILGIDNQAIELNIFDFNGRLIRQEKHDSNTFQFKKNELSQGIYLYQIKGKEGVLANGRMSIF
jgi:uncharacterized repeat protein (TIGR01451 family)